MSIRQQQFEKARKMTESEYGDRPVYDPRESGPHDGYFESIESLRDFCAIGKVPEWVFGTSVKKFHIKAEHVLEMALTDHHEDAADEVDQDSLQVALDAWVAANPVTTHEEDRSVVVMLDKAGE